MPKVEPACVQFGCADWFWDQWPNSYTLQVEPAAHRFKDQAVLAAGEAMQTQRARDRFFEGLRRLLAEAAARYQPAAQLSARHRASEGLALPVNRCRRASLSSGLRAQPLAHLARERPYGCVRVALHELEPRDRPRVGHLGERVHRQESVRARPGRDGLARGLQ